MPENNHEVIIDGYVYPDTVTITLANDDFVGSRDYVSKDLYESVDGANDYWQAENAKLREERDGWKKLCTDQEVMHVMHEETLDNENAKLRELVRGLISHVEHPPCEGCMAEMNCDGEHVTQCDEWLFMVADARKLGVEVTA